MRRDTHQPVHAEGGFSRATARRGSIRLSIYADALCYSRDPDAMTWHDALKWAVSMQDDGTYSDAAMQRLEQRLGGRLKDSTAPEAPVWREALAWARRYRTGSGTPTRDFVDRFGVRPACLDGGGELPQVARVAYQAVRAAEERTVLAKVMAAADQDVSAIAGQADEMRELARRQAAESGMRGLVDEVERRLGADRAAA
jgi:hypothetical protein